MVFFANLHVLLIILGICLDVQVYLECFKFITIGCDSPQREALLWHHILVTRRSAFANENSLYIPHLNSVHDASS